MSTCGDGGSTAVATMILMPKPQRAQLLELLDFLERARRRRADGFQAAGAISVEADVPLHGRHTAVARPRNRRAAEVQRPTVLVGDDLDEVRVAKLGLATSSGAVSVAIAACGCQPSSRAVCAMQSGEISGSSPCTLTTICCVVPLEPPRELGDPIRAARMLRRRQLDARAELAARGGDALVVGRDDDFAALRS